MSAFPLLNNGGDDKSNTNGCLGMTPEEGHHADLGTNATYAHRRLSGTSPSQEEVDWSHYQAALTAAKIRCPSALTNATTVESHSIAGYTSDPTRYPSPAYDTDRERGGGGGEKRSSRVGAVMALASLIDDSQTAVVLTTTAKQNTNNLTTSNHHTTTATTTTSASDSGMANSASSKLNHSVVEGGSYAIIMAPTPSTTTPPLYDFGKLTITSCHLSQSLGTPGDTGAESSTSVFNRPPPAAVNDVVFNNNTKQLQLQLQHEGMGRAAGGSGDMATAKPLPHFPPAVVGCLLTPNDESLVASQAEGPSRANLHNITSKPTTVRVASPVTPIAAAAAHGGHLRTCSNAPPVFFSSLANTTAGDMSEDFNWFDDTVELDADGSDELLVVCGGRAVGTGGGHDNQKRVGKTVGESDDCFPLGAIGRKPQHNQHNTVGGNTSVLASSMTTNNTTMAVGSGSGASPTSGYVGGGVGGGAIHQTYSASTAGGGGAASLGFYGSLSGASATWNRSTWGNGADTNNGAMYLVVGSDEEEGSGLAAVTTNELHKQLHRDYQHLEALSAAKDVGAHSTSPTTPSSRSSSSPSFASATGACSALEPQNTDAASVASRTFYNCGGSVVATNNNEDDDDHADYDDDGTYADVEDEGTYWDSYRSTPIARSEVTTATNYTTTAANHNNHSHQQSSTTNGAVGATMSRRSVYSRAASACCWGSTRGRAASVAATMSVADCWSPTNNNSLRVAATDCGHGYGSTSFHLAENSFFGPCHGAHSSASSSSSPQNSDAEVEEGLPQTSSGPAPRGNRDMLGVRNKRLVTSLPIPIPVVVGPRIGGFGKATTASNRQVVDTDGEAQSSSASAHANSDDEGEDCINHELCSMVVGGSVHTMPLSSRCVSVSMTYAATTASGVVGAAVGGFGGHLTTDGQPNGSFFHHFGTRSAAEAEEEFMAHCGSFVRADGTAASLGAALGCFGSTSVTSNTCFSPTSLAAEGRGGGLLSLGSNSVVCFDEESVAETTTRQTSAVVNPPLAAPDMDAVSTVGGRAMGSNSSRSDDNSSSSEAEEEEVGSCATTGCGRSVAFSMLGRMTEQQSDFDEEEETADCDANADDSDEAEEEIVASVAAVTPPQRAEAGSALSVDASYFDPFTGQPLPVAFYHHPEFFFTYLEASSSSDDGSDEEEDENDVDDSLSNDDGEGDTRLGIGAFASTKLSTTPTNDGCYEEDVADTTAAALLEINMSVCTDAYVSFAHNASSDSVSAAGGGFGEFVAVPTLGGNNSLATYKHPHPLVNGGGGRRDSSATAAPSADNTMPAVHPSDENNNKKKAREVRAIDNINRGRAVAALLTSFYPNPAHRSKDPADALVDSAHAVTDPNLVSFTQVVYAMALLKRLGMAEAEAKRIYANQRKILVKLRERTRRGVGGDLTCNASTTSSLNATVATTTVGGAAAAGASSVDGGDRDSTVSVGASQTSLPLGRITAFPSSPSAAASSPSYFFVPASARRALGATMLIAGKIHEDRYPPASLIAEAVGLKMKQRASQPTVVTSASASATPPAASTPAPTFATCATDGGEGSVALTGAEDLFSTATPITVARGVAVDGGIVGNDSPLSTTYTTCAYTVATANNNGVGILSDISAIVSPVGTAGDVTTSASTSLGLLEAALKLKKHLATTTTSVTSSATTAATSVVSRATSIAETSSLDHLARTEGIILDKLQWSVHVTPQEYHEVFNELMACLRREEAE